MKRYLFILHGLRCREVWMVGKTERDAHQNLWDSLDDDERDRLQELECVDVQTDESIAFPVSP